MENNIPSKQNKLPITEIATFGMLGSVMYVSKLLMEFLPNIHLLGSLIVAITIVFRKKALYPIYTYVLLEGLFGGFSTWWIPYLYIWTILWGITMLLPSNINYRIKPFIYAILCSVHGFLFGTLYAPVQALLFGLNLKGMIAWIIAGFPFDIIHGISNFIIGLILICPLIKVLTYIKIKIVINA